MKRGLGAGVRGAGSDFDDSTIITARLVERISFARKQFKAKRSCKQEVMMRAEFRYKGHGKEMVVRIVRRETGLLAAVAILGRVISFLGGLKNCWDFDSTRLA